MLAKPHCDVIKNDGRQTKARLGLVVAKKNVRLAVDRNRVKRLIRESFRRRQHLLEGIDIIVLARRGVDRQSNRQLFKAIDEQWLIIRKKANRANATRATLA